jgi:hypothetical protein
MIPWLRCMLRVVRLMNHAGRDICVTRHCSLGVHIGRTINSIAAWMSGGGGTCDGRALSGMGITGWRMRRARAGTGTGAFALLPGPVFGQGADDGAANRAEEAVAGLVTHVASCRGATEGTEDATLAFGSFDGRGRSL